MAERNKVTANDEGGHGHTKTRKPHMAMDNVDVLSPVVSRDRRTDSAQQHVYVGNGA